MKLRSEWIDGTASTLILSVLNTGAAHGHEIVRRINELSDGVFEWQEEILYPALRELESGELVRGEWEAASCGRMQCVYSLTENGKRALMSGAQEWSIYSSAVANILEASYA